MEEASLDLSCEQGNVLPRIVLLSCCVCCFAVSSHSTLACMDVSLPNLIKRAQHKHLNRMYRTSTS